MDWQSILAFCVMFHVTSFLFDEVRKIKAKSEMDGVLRSLRTINAQLEEQEKAQLKRVK